MLLLLRFGKADAAISPAVVRPGDDFTLTYRQAIRRGTQIYTIGVFLVYREWVDHQAQGKEWKTFSATEDRLIQMFQQEGRFYRAGETLHMMYPFVKTAEALC